MDEQPAEHKKSSSATTALIVIALIIILGVGVVGYQMMNQKPAQTQQASNPTSAPTAAQAPEAAMKKESGTYKDGTYEAVGDYTSPGGPETLKVSVTLKDDTIADAIVTPQATRPNSVKFQGIFASNYKPLVVGKKIDEVQLTKVSGSSLAPKGFNDALEKIKTQAKS